MVVSNEQCNSTKNNNTITDSLPQATLHAQNPLKSRNIHVLTPPTCIHSKLDLSIAGAEDDGGGQAGNWLVVLGVYVGEDGVLALFLTVNKWTCERIGFKGVPTFGISLGSSTVLVKVRGPSLMGHSRSTFLTCSHRSALVLIRRIRPYFTCNATYAPSSTVSLRMPDASMMRSCPLHVQSWC